MKYFLTVMMLIFFASTAQADTTFYDTCKQKLQGKFSPEKLEAGCICSQKKADKYVHQGVKGDKLAKIISNCFSQSLETSAYDVYYEGCLDNPKYASNLQYQKYCACSASVYSKELLKYGANAHLDKKLQEQLHQGAVKEAARQCLPKKR